MLSGFLKNFIAPARVDSQAEHRHDQLALAVLLVRLARADGDYSPAECDRILELLCSYYSLSPDEGYSLRQQAQELEAEAHDTVRFTRILKQSIPHEERLEIFELLWAVVLSDERPSDSEKTLMRLVAGLLGVRDMESNRIRKKLAARKADG